MSPRRFAVTVDVGTELHDRLCEAVDECGCWVLFGGSWCYVDQGCAPISADVWRWVLVDRGFAGAV
jgi:hypothetical protein